MVLALEVIDSNMIAASTLQAIRDLCSEAYREDFSHAFELLGPGVHVIGRLDEEIVSHGSSRLADAGAFTPLTSKPSRPDRRFSDAASAPA